VLLGGVVLILMLVRLERKFSAGRGNGPGGPWTPLNI
jgi:hypothetical protein